MLAAVFQSKNEIRLEQRPVPSIREDEVLVQIEVCGLCGTDIAKIEQQSVSPGTILGHEISGIIVKIGEKVTRFQLGDHVYVAHHVPCFTCDQCRKGRFSLCPQYKETNVEPGGFAQYIRVSAQHIQHTVGHIDSLTFEEGAFVEPIACSLYGLRKIQIDAGDDVLILGAGQIGLIFLQLIQMRFPKNIIVADKNEFRLQQATQFGASGVINIFYTDLVTEVHEVTNGIGVETVIICAGVKELLPLAISCLKRGGTVLVFAPFSNELLAIDSSVFFQDEIKVIGSYSSSPYDYPLAKQLIAKKIVDVDKMITHRFGLAQLLEAVQCAKNPEATSVKVVIHPQLRSV